MKDWLSRLDVVDVMMLLIVGGMTAPLFGLGIWMVVGSLRGCP